MRDFLSHFCDVCGGSVYVELVRGLPQEEHSRDGSVRALCDRIKSIQAQLDRVSEWAEDRGATGIFDDSEVDE